MSDSNETFLGTEDDTFRILSRPSIHKMVVLHKEWVKKKSTRYNGVYHQYNSMLNLEFAKYYGWGWVEYLKAKKESGYNS